MKNIINKKIKYIITGLILIIMINIAISFAYIRGTTLNNESQSTVALTGGRVNVKYKGNTSDIIVNDILPGFETTKQFTVTSEFGNNHEYYKDGVWYTIALVVDKNDFDDGSIVCSVLADDSSDSDGILANASNVFIPTGENIDGIPIASGRFDNNNMAHIYNLKISYPETGANQSHMVNAEFQAHVILINPQLINLTFDLDGGSFTNLNLNENSSIKVPANSTFNLAIPIKNELTFTGWEVVSGNVSVDNNVISTNGSDVTVKALWWDAIPHEFHYTGDEQEFIAEVPGYYKLEVWGAQGGSYNENYYGGYGGYSTGEMQLNKDEMIYIYVGGTTSDITGGYNGGGGTGSVGKGGGGATHISKVNGELSSLSQYAQNNKSPILIVSGGGGGAYYENFANVEFFGNIGGNSGGYIGGSGVSSKRNTAYGGTQTSGGKCADSSNISGSFGNGGTGPSFSAGGGGGYYGGAAGGTDRENGGDYGTGGGGSSYIGNYLLTDKYMYCYNCETSDVESTKTYSTTCAEEAPTENCAKKGNGYAKITYLHS